VIFAIHNPIYTPLFPLDMRSSAGMHLHTIDHGYAFSVTTSIIENTGTSYAEHI